MGDEIPISKKLQDISDANAQNPNSPKAKLMSGLATAAILHGPTSADWQNYMLQVVDNNSPKQLARLTLKEAKTQNDPEMQRSAAYIIANGMCTPDTTTQTGLGVNKTVVDQPF